jgi:hypothetical protein
MNAYVIMIHSEKYVDGIYQEKKMSVKVKDVGSYKIHIKETRSSIIDEVYFWMLPALIFVASMFYYPITTMDFSNSSFVGGDINMLMISMLSTLMGTLLIMYFTLTATYDRFFSTPAYYLDTTMYGIGGKTIRKTTPEQDHIAICKASHEFEMQILERIKKEDELKAIVGVCK